MLAGLSTSLLLLGENKRDGRSGGERWGSGGGRRENRRKRAKEVLAVRKAWERNGVLAADSDSEVAGRVESADIEQERWGKLDFRYYS